MGKHVADQGYIEIPNWMDDTRNTVDLTNVVDGVLFETYEDDGYDRSFSQVRLDRAGVERAVDFLVRWLDETKP